MVTLDRLIFSKLLSPRLDLLFERLVVRNKMSYLYFLISFSVFCFRWFCCLCSHRKGHDFYLRHYLGLDRWKNLAKHWREISFARKNFEVVMSQYVTYLKKLTYISRILSFPHSFIVIVLHSQSTHLNPCRPHRQMAQLGLIFPTTLCSS